MTDFSEIIKVTSGTIIQESAFQDPYFRDSRENRTINVYSSSSIFISKNVYEEILSIINDFIRDIFNKGSINIIKYKLCMLLNKEASYGEVSLTDDTLPGIIYKEPFWDLIP